MKRHNVISIKINEAGSDYSQSDDSMEDDESDIDWDAVDGRARVLGYSGDFLICEVVNMFFQTHYC